MSRRTKLPRAALGVLVGLLAGCAAGPHAGISLEAGLGGSRVNFGRADLAGGYAPEWTVGAALEADVGRASWMSAGGVYRSIRGPGATTSTGAFASRYSLGTLLDLPHTGAVRPRAGLSLAWGDGFGGELAWNAGVSFHPAQGIGIHLLAGPHVMAASFDDHAAIGYGWQLRARVLKLFFADNDQPEEIYDRDDQWRVR